MSTAKRPGSRDISDLKARLGLKKKKPAPLGGAVAPPRQQTGAIPAPPGVAPPSPPQPVQAPVPDAASDPFGAMNAIAANASQAASHANNYTSSSRAVAAPILDARHPVANIEKKAGVLRYLKVAGIVLVPLILGMVIGQIGSKAAHYNRTINDSKNVRADVEAVGKRLLAIQNTLQLAQDRGSKGGKPWYLPNDQKLTTELASLEALNPNTDVVFKSFLYDLPPEISKEIFLFYTEIGRLAKSIKEHVKISAGDEKVIKGGAAKLGSFNPRGYAGLLRPPTPEQANKGVPTKVQLVQLGQPICEPDGKPSSEGCSKLPAKFQYRISETGAFATKKIVGAESAISGSQLIYFDPETPLFRGILQGGGPTVAEVAYMKRIEDIHNRVEILIQVRKNILTTLNGKAKESTKFDFFMGG